MTDSKQDFMEGIKDKLVFAIEQPADVDGNEIIVRPTAQSQSEVRAARALD